MTASSRLKRRWRWRLSSRTLTPSAVQTVTVCPMIVMFGLVGSLAGGQRGKPVCWWNVSCRWWQQPCRKSAVELAASEAKDVTRWKPRGLTNCPDQRILHHLQPVDVVDRHCSSALAYSSAEMTQCCGRWSWRRRVAAAVGCGAQCACVIAAAAYDFRDVSVHSQDWVKCDTEQLDVVAKRDHRPCDVNAARRRIYVWNVKDV